MHYGDQNRKEVQKGFTLLHSRDSHNIVQQPYSIKVNLKNKRVGKKFLKNPNFWFVEIKIIEPSKSVTNLW